MPFNALHVGEYLWSCLQSTCLGHLLGDAYWGLTMNRRHNINAVEHEEHKAVWT